MNRIVLAIGVVLATVAPRGAGGQQQRDSLLHYSPRSPMELMAQEFRSARSPSTSELVGSWRASRHVATEVFVHGRTGPDHVYSDSMKLEFRLSSARQLESRYTYVHRWTLATRNSSGDVVFDADDSGDVESNLSCRLTASKRLICFDLAHAGQGAGDAVEFERQAPPFPSRRLGRE